MEERSRGRSYVGIAAAGAAVMLLEIGLTRIFSYTIWYHFAYMTIGVALLGFGASGSALAAFPSLQKRPEWLSIAAIGAQLGTLICLVVVGTIPLDPENILSDTSELGVLLVYYIALILPFFAAGLLIAGPIQAAPKMVSRLYFSDLLGAGIACAVVVPLIWWVGTPVATSLATIPFGIAAWAYASPRRQLRSAVVAAGMAVATITCASMLPFKAAPTKFLNLLLLHPGAELAYSEWTPVNRVDVVTFDPLIRTGNYIEWGISPKYKKGGPGFYMIGNDGDSCAVIYKWDGNPDSLDFFRHHVLRSAYTMLDDPDVLVIGLGGGADVLNGLVNGANSITGIELNRMTVHAGKTVFNEFNGNVLNHPKVEALAGEGRSFMRSRPDKYDLINVNAVDTFSAQFSGSFVLAESFLYTSDAVHDYLDHLKPGGIFSMGVGDVNSVGQPPRHALRVASMVRRVLDERGWAEPLRHVMVVSQNSIQPWTVTMVKEEPFTDADVARIDQYVEEEGFVFWHHPNYAIKSVVSPILASSPAELDAYYNVSRLNLRPTTDDSPFFFNFFRWRTLMRGETRWASVYDRTVAAGHVVLLIMLVQSILFSAVLILAPLARVKRGQTSRGRMFAYLTYFVALGSGFIVLEISFIQRFVLFLGYPTYSLTVVMLALLTFTGLGSYRTGRIEHAFVRELPRMLGLLLAISLTYWLGIPVLFDMFLEYPMAVRIVISVILLAPLGFVLGSFFPIGIRILERSHPQLVPWGWSVNACATVVGTISAVIVGMTWSFSTALLLAVTIYTIGVLGLYFAEGGAEQAD